MIKVIPNCLSIIRIMLSFSLIIVGSLSTTFYAIYLICGISDMLDGFIARRMGASSKFGARLDTVADLIMVTVVFFKLYPLLELPSNIVIWVILIFVLRLISVAVVLVKHKTLAILHTYSNKVAGMSLFLVPIFLIPTFSLNYSSLWMYIICSIASLSAVEELIIHLTSSQLQLDRKSIFI